ncbi:DNA excision repair protein ERCC-5-like [Homarus americanus]|uniref:DNA excision repair protein ERCC-5-like n=1 Tax=Homarus americanus TaxID=6706 RepID=UPI001C4436AD|nr:DNA excision repair protein ERCC-5-like [Homarus americanus]
MGVKGLWKLIECAGVPVPLETLEHKILAVDVSIWLHQAVRGFRGPGGAAVANAHLLTLFHRICKLLFYRIRPVFVFDGGVPYLKKQTLASRKLRRDVAADKAKLVRERLLKNLLKSQAVRKALGRTGPGPSLAHVPRPQKKEKDMFELPPLPKPEMDDSVTSVKSEDSEDEDQYILRNLKLPNLHQFDFESNEFKSLNIETQHEILSELQSTRKQNSWNRINEMPKEAENFAEFQMGRLIKRRDFQATLDSTRDEIRKVKTAEMEAEMFGELEKHVSLSQRIISEDSAHSILVKKIKDDKKDEVLVKEDKDEVLVKEDKGKSPMKKKQKSFGKDFLTELAKQGIVRPQDHSDSDSDDLCYPPRNLNDNSLSEMEDGGQNSIDIEEEGFLNVVGALLENSGLTQEEILALIKQDSNNQSRLKSKSGSEDGPSTSEKAPGFVFNPDADLSSDDEDFIEVSETPSENTGIPKSDDEKVGIEQIDGNNIDKLLATKSDSLWMKIIHQKVDDLVHTNSLKSSPKKAVLDTRKFGCQEVKKETYSLDGESLKPVKISLDFDVKPLKMEDDIFTDIFTDLIHQPKKSLISNPVSVSNNIKNIKNGSEYIKPQCETQPLTCTENLSKSGKTSEGLLVSKTNSKLEDEFSVSAGTCNNISTSEKHSIKEKPKIVPVCSSNQASDEPPKNIMEVNTSQKEITVQEHVRLKIKDKVNTASQGNKSELNIAHEVGEEDADDVEIMSSSDDSDSDETPTVISQHSEVGEKAGSNKTCTVSPTSDTKQMPFTCDADDNDFIEVEEISTNRMNTEINYEMKHAHSDAKPESKTNLGSEMEQTTKEYKSLSVEGKGRVEEEPNIESRHRTSSDQQVMDIDLTTKNDKVVDLVEEGTKVENVMEVERPLNYSEDELKHLEGELAVEQKSLIAQAQKSDRIASNLNDQMYGESQHLLQLFGIPYLVAPMEAEAQCAFLNAANLAAGTITDDSDIFLFGGNKVYKNFFNQTKHVEFFNVDNIQANIGLNRNKMITLALLTGSDYTEGVESVGAVTAMEVLVEFPGEGIECLRNLKKWWNVAHKNVTSSYISKVKQKMSQVMLMESFPNEKVYEAYLKPEVDESREKFTWSVPNVEALRTFTMEKFGWNREKADEILKPMMKKLGVKTSQMRIDSYFTNIKLVKESKVISKRVQDAIAKAKGESPPNSGTPSIKDRYRKPSIRGKSKKKNARDSEDLPGKVMENGVLDEEEHPDTTHKLTPPKPSRTLLIDPSESSSCVPEPPKAKRKRKKKSEESETNGPQQSSAMHDNEEDYQPPRKLTKEVMYKALLEKETISQRDSDQRKMEERKAAAAQLLKKQRELRKTHR